MKTKDKVANAIKWIDGLLVTRYKQGEGQLGDKEQGFCCLGYGCHVLGVGYDPTSSFSGDFAEKVGLHNRTSSFRPAVQVDDFRTCNSLAELNDTGSVSFNKIAKFMINRDFSMFEDEVSDKLVEHYKQVINT